MIDPQIPAGYLAGGIDLAKFKQIVRKGGGTAQLLCVHTTRAITVPIMHKLTELERVRRVANYRGIISK